ncbi:hypothetical protein HV241_09105 [Citrobacter freundii]|uniref:hypothetical protein n=1 Tax=Citrobacter freundii TaxID=546 RepID=UPI0015EA8907|nr:hypothetical protein [Citrobacter freundii]QLY69188.1 hypothetical protein HV241_09105 [Citrobacter freundii]
MPGEKTCLSYMALKLLNSPRVRWRLPRFRPPLLAWWERHLMRRGEQPHRDHPVQEGASRTWQVRKIPATAADIGAIPKDPIGKIVNNGTMASASTPGWWLVSLDKPETVADFPKYPNGNRLYSYGFMFVARSGNIWLQQYFTHTGASAHRQTWNGDMSEQTPWVIDYSTANPPPATDLSAYATQQWVLQNFVQNIRVSAAQERKFWDGNGWSGNDSAFATAIWMVGGSSNVGGLLVRYVQKQINNNWYNITE